MAPVFVQVYASASFSPSGRTKMLSKFLITNIGGEQELATYSDRRTLECPTEAKNAGGRECAVWGM